MEFFCLSKHHDIVFIKECHDIEFVKECLSKRHDIEFIKECMLFYNKSAVEFGLK